MKRFFMFCVTLTTLCFFSACEKNPETYEDAIIGKWQMTHYLAYTNGELEEDYQFSEEEAYFYEFFKGSTGLQYSPDKSILYNFIWKLEGTLLTRYFDDGRDHTEVWTIKKLTDNILSVEMSVVQDDVTFKYIFDFKKVK